MQSTSVVSRSLARLAFWLATAGCLSTPPSSSADSESSRHAAETNLLKRVAAEISDRCLEDIQSRAGWEKQRPELRRQLLYMLGLDPLPHRSPLKSVITGTIDHPAYRVEKVVFQSLPGVYVTGNFYTSKQRSGPAPTILYLCGHSAHPLGAKVHYQDRVLWYAENGYNVLILDTLEFGEVPGIHHGTHNLQMWHWLSLGYTPAGTEVWSAMRALDWLETRPEVDTNRIGLTGISGGGAMTWFVAALDERIAVAAPSCSTYTFGSQAGHWLASGQCDCIYYHNTYLWDFPIVAALIAPRPLLITSGQRDPIFPPDGYHEVFRRGSRIYDLIAGGKSDRIREVDADVGHSDPPLFLESSRQWMNRWLLGTEKNVTYPPLSEPRHTASELACLKELPHDAANFRIQHELTSPASLRAPRSQRAWRERSEWLRQELKDKVFRWFPKEPLPFATETLGRQRGYLSSYGPLEEVSFETEPGVRIRAHLISAKSPTNGTPLVISIERPGDNVYGSDADEILPLLGRCHVLVVNPRFTEVDLSSKEFTDIERTAAWAGRTVGSMQIWDILRTVDWALTERHLSTGPVILYAKGHMSALSFYAAALDARVTEVIANQPADSHWRGPALLNVLRITDLPEVAGMIAPRPLTFLNPPPTGYDLTRKIYRTQRAERSFRQAASLPEAVLNQVPLNH